MVRKTKLETEQYIKDLAEKLKAKLTPKIKPIKKESQLLPIGAGNVLFCVECKGNLILNRSNKIYCSRRCILKAEARKQRNRRKQRRANGTHKEFYRKQYLKRKENPDYLKKKRKYWQKYYYSNHELRKKKSAEKQKRYRNKLKLENPEKLKQMTRRYNFMYRKNHKST